MILILISFENKEHYKKVANYLIDNRLAACVTVFPVDSFYFWDGKKVNYQEFEAIVKTKKENFAKIEKAMAELLHYDVPQLIAIEAIHVNTPYLKWLEEETR